MLLKKKIKEYKMDIDTDIENNLEQIHNKYDENKEILNLDVEWNDKLENAAKDIGDSAKGYKIMHINQAQKLSLKYNILMITGIILGPLSGVVSTIDTVSEADSQIPGIIISILGFLSGITITILKFGKYEESSNSNKQAAARYTSIESSVRRQLSLYRKDRVDAIPYMNWLETKFSELFLSAPLLSENTYRHYKNIATENGWPIPQNYDNTIIINSDYEDNKIREIGEVSHIKINTKEEDSENNNQMKNLNIDIKPNKGTGVTIDRTNNLSNFPELNQYSDKMLQYELDRMMGFK